MLNIRLWWTANYYNILGKTCRRLLFSFHYAGCQLLSLAFSATSLSVFMRFSLRNLDCHQEDPFSETKLNNFSKASSSEFLGWLSSLLNSHGLGKNSSMVLIRLLSLYSTFKHPNWRLDNFPFPSDIFTSVIFRARLLFREIKSVCKGSDYPTNVYWYNYRITTSIRVSITMWIHLEEKQYLPHELQIQPETLHEKLINHLH